MKKIEKVLGGGAAKSGKTAGKGRKMTRVKPKAAEVSQATPDASKAA